MANPHRRDFTHSSNPNDGQNRWPSLRIEGHFYEVLSQLSLPRRGRWKVRDPQPRPRGTIRTAIVLEDTPASQQLERSLRRLPTSVNGIPQLHACGWHQGQKVWIVTWIHGTELETYLQRVHDGKYRRLSVWESVRRMKSLAHQLRILQQDLGIVHGDIKPGNLILPSERGSIGLIDYGSSWQTERTSRRDLGDGVGEGYTAPELLESRFPLDWRADQFSAGVVLYEMLTMELPYCGLGGKAGLFAERAELETAHRPPSEMVTDAANIPRSILAELDAVVGRTLQLDANRRFGTPSEFCQAMDSLFHHLKGAQDAIQKNSWKLSTSQDAIQKNSWKLSTSESTTATKNRQSTLQNLFKRFTELMGGE